MVTIEGKCKKLLNLAEKKYLENIRLKKRISASNKIRSKSNRKISSSNEKYFEKDQFRKKKKSRSKKIIFGFIIGSIIFGITSGIIINNDNMKVKEDIFFNLFILTRLPADYRFQVSSSADWWGHIGDDYDEGSKMRRITKINKSAGLYNYSCKGYDIWGDFQISSGGFIEVELYLNGEFVDSDNTSKLNDWVSVNKEKPLTIYDYLLLFHAMTTGGKLGMSMMYYCWIYYTEPPM